MDLMTIRWLPEFLDACLVELRSGETVHISVRDVEEEIAFREALAKRGATVEEISRLVTHERD